MCVCGSSYIKANIVGPCIKMTDTSLTKELQPLVVGLYFSAPWNLRLLHGLCIDILFN
jgi:hypothetical protein